MMDRCLKLKSIKFIMLIVLAVSLSACFGGGGVQGPTKTAAGTKIVNGKPYWYWEPGNGGKLGSVGASKPHVKGVTFQRQLAVERAIDAIARQMGVKVSNIVKTESQMANGTAKTAMETYSIQTTSGRTVTAVAKEFWHDSTTNELLVWMLVK